MPTDTIHSAAAPGAAAHDRWDTLASSVLGGGPIARADALSVLQAGDASTLDVLAGAYRVRRATFGNRVKLNYLVNAKSGACPEDCNYCSQSIISEAEIERYSLMSEDDIVTGATRAASLRASTCCIVLSGKGPNSREVARVAGAAQRIKEAHPEMRICACLGLLKDGQAEQLKDAGVDRYNHNINTSENNYDGICSTHSYDDRIDTIEKSKAAGISPCSGVIIGMNETDDDIVEMAFALRDLNADSIPVNFLIPIEGTPMADGARALAPNFCLRVLSMFRFVCPTTEIRVSAGREGHLRTLQPLGLYPANALFVSDYLTTEGQSPTLDWQMIEDLGFVVEGHEGKPSRMSASPVHVRPGKSEPCGVAAGCGTGCGSGCGN